MNQKNTGCKRTSGILAGIPLCFLFLAVQAHAVGIVSARYLIRTSTELTLEIKVGTPSPVSLIIIQRLPPETTLASANPPYKKYNPQKGEVRWLLRKVPAGTLSVQLKLSAPINPDKVSAEIRCMDPVTGKLVTTRVK